MIVVFSAALILLSSCSLADDAAPSDQSDPFSEKDRKAGDRAVKVINGVEFAFRWCPAGTFMMGSPESEENRKDDEHQHQVTLTKGFWMMETEVTQKQWRAILEYNPVGVYIINNNKYPVQNVSWNDCQLFCQKCTELGLHIQLPTEAQWEYACRAGTTEEYAGDLREMGWYGQIGRICPVRMKMPNEWGLYDMHGNVCELCSDWYGSYPHQSVTDPEGPASGLYHVMRGGCINTGKELCRSANRGKCFSDFKHDKIGFRCVIGKGVPSTYTPPTPQKTAVKPKSNVIHIDKFGQGAKAGERKTAVIYGIEFAFRWCPPGTFLMGSPESEKGRENNETQHQVTLTKGFWMLETEVTQEQWEAIMEYNPSSWVWKTFPVNEISWFKCQDFCKKCNELGLPVQLPTEAQWEYACRAGTTEAFYGNEDEIGWFKSNCGDRIHPVGMKKPNAWGLYDMHGNLFEWCQDWIGDYPSESVTDPVGPAEGDARVYRGGCFLYYPFKYCRSAARHCSSPSSRVASRVGVRVIISLDLEASKFGEIESANEKNEPETVVTQDNFGNGEKPGDRKTMEINGVEFAFRWCPPGTFIMGSPESEKGRQLFGHGRETQHKVTLTKGFWMLETEVTVGMFKAFVNDTKYVSKGNTPRYFNGLGWVDNPNVDWLKPGFNQDDNHPVTCVSWDDAAAFCDWLSKKTGRKIKLPTEAQWEYACRAGSTTAFFWGNALNGDKANCDGSSPCGTNVTGKNLSKTAPVRSYEPNSWGLYDMHGNVWEWCADIFTLDCSSENVTDPTGPLNGLYRVKRGGGWNSYSMHCRSANRYNDKPEERGGDWGFRCIISQ